ncbi:MAG: tetratricopeptide repeat protein [Limisphaerales bacterium]
MIRRLLSRLLGRAPFAVVAVLLATVFGCSRKPNVQALLDGADRSFERREFEAAKIQYISVLRTQLTNTHAQLRLGRIYFEQGQLQHAFSLLRTVQDSYPDDIPLHEALAVIYSVAGTNLWKPEVEALLRIQPTNETAVMTLLRTANTPEEITGVANTVAALRARAGEHAVFILADGEIAQRRGDKAEAIAAFRRAIAAEPGSVLAHLTLGTMLFAEGQNEEGLSLYAKAAELSPPHGPARLRYAQALLQQGREEDAVRVLDELNSKAPEMIPAWTTRAEVAFARKEYAEARRLLDRALIQNPTDPLSLRVRAKVDLAERKPADAVQALESAARWMPGSSDVQHQLGVAHLLNGDLTKAIAHLRQAVRLNPKTLDAALLLAELEIRSGNSGDAIGMLSAITQSYPGVYQARMLLARAYRATGRLDEALNTLSTTATQFSTNTAPLLQLGLVYRQKQNRDRDARAAFEACLKLDPLNPMALEQLVQLDVKAGDRANAMARIEERLKATPEDPLPWLIQSELLRTAGDTPGTEAALRKVLELDPESQPALVGLAQLYITTGRNAEALAELERAVQKTPDNVGALTLIGMLQSEVGKYPEARAAYETALKAQPKSALVLNNLAYLLAEKFNDVGGAYEIALRARLDNPQSSIIADTLGWIEYRRGNYTEALRLLTDSAEELGRNPEIQYHLGMAHYMMGHEAQAAVALRQALQSTDKFEGRDVAATHLAVLETPSEPATAESIAALEKRRSEEPKDLIALSRLASSYSAAGAVEKAREVFDAALKVNPNSPDILSRYALFQIQKLGASTRALELARQARQLAPQDPVIAHTAGKAASLAGDHPYAFSLLQDSAGRLPLDTAVRYDFGVAALAVGRLDLTTNAMATVAQSGPPPLAARAKVFGDLVALALGPTPAQVPAPLQEAMRAEPGSLVVQFANARLAESRGQTAEAQTAYEKILSIYPSFIPAARQLALLLAGTPGGEGKAYDLALKIRQDLPRDAEVAASLGILACQRGDYRFSIQLLTEATRSRGQDGDALFHLGVAHLGLKQTSEGKAALEKAVAAAPNGKFVPEAKKLLSEIQ